MRQLSGMTVVITGASAGIGRALAIELARRGARLALIARRRERLDELLATLGTGHLAIAADVADDAACAAAISVAAEQLGRVDTLVCNAGSGLFRAGAETSRAEWDALMAVNLHGTLACVRAAVPLQRAQPLRDGWRGQMVIVSSILARRGAPHCAAYCASKAAQLSLAEALRLELRPERIAVTSVHPIGTRTDFFTTADARSGHPVREQASAWQQSAEHVARRMAAAIARPTREVWPSRASRWLTALGILSPAIGDWATARMTRDRI